MFTYIPKQVCASEMKLKIKEDMIEDIQINGGCPGSSVGMARLIVGMNVYEALKRLKGVPCGSKNTSCPDQLSLALEAYLNQK